MIPATLEVRHCQTYLRTPLCTLRNLPGPGADMRPDEMRALAAALLTAADDCESRPMSKRSYCAVNHSYDLQAGAR